MNAQTTAVAVQGTGSVTDSILIKDGKGLTPTNFTGLWEMARILSVSGTMPRDLTNKPEAIFAIINMGYELGISPMAAVQNISVINGRVTVWGDLMIAIVRASGKLTRFSERFIGEFPTDNFAAVCECQRGQESIKTEFSVADAKAAKLWAYPSAGVTPWHKYPKRMLQMRARSWALRDMFSDVLKGIAATEELTEYDISVEPQENGVYAATEHVKQKKKAQKTEQKKPETEPDPEPEKLPIERLNNLVNAKNCDEACQEKLTAYISEVAALKKKNETDIVDMALSHFERFWNSFAKWIEEQKQQQETAVEQANSDDPPVDVYPFCDAEIMVMSDNFPDEYKQACLEISDPTSKEKCDAVKKRVRELLDIAALDDAIDYAETELL